MRGPANRSANSNLSAFTSISRVFHKYFTSISRAFHEHFTSISRAFHEHITSISRVFHEYFTSILQVFCEYFKSISRVFCEYFTSISQVFGVQNLTILRNIFSPTKLNETGLGPKFRSERFLVSEFLAILNIQNQPQKISKCAQNVSSLIKS